MGAKLSGGLNYVEFNWILWKSATLFWSRGGRYLKEIIHNGTNCWRLVIGTSIYYVNIGRSKLMFLLCHGWHIIFGPRHPFIWRFLSFKSGLIAIHTFHVGIAFSHFELCFQGTEIDADFELFRCKADCRLDSFNADWKRLPAIMKPDACPCSNQPNPKKS